MAADIAGLSLIIFFLGIGLYPVAIFLGLIYGLLHII